MYIRARDFHGNILYHWKVRDNVGHLPMDLVDLAKRPDIQLEFYQIRMWNMLPGVLCNNFYAVNCSRLLIGNATCMTVINSKINIINDTRNADIISAKVSLGGVSKITSESLRAHYSVECTPGFSSCKFVNMGSQDLTRITIGRANYTHFGNASDFYLLGVGFRGNRHIAITIGNIVFANSNSNNGDTKTHMYVSLIGIHGGAKCLFIQSDYVECFHRISLPKYRIFRRPCVRFHRRVLY